MRLFWYLRDNQMYPDEAETVDFFESANFSVTRLQYWNKGFESANIFYRKCEAVAKGLDRYFRTNHAAYEEENQIDRSKALNRLFAGLADEGSVFADLAALCDALYRCISEAR